MGNVTSRYDAFLFAPINDESGGMRLSVLSALARMNVDPWDEAARLATLSTSDAARDLVSTLSLLPGHPHASLETEILAARLVALLPKAGAAAAAKVATITGDPGQNISYWIVWLCIAIAIAFLPSHWQATTTGTGGAIPAPSGASSRADTAPTAPPAGSTAR